MLADAADECLHFTRLLDSEDTDSAKLNEEVAGYLARLRCLFTEGQRVSLPGYTSFMLKNLQRSTRAARWDGTSFITLGCPHRVSLPIISKCVAQMRGFTEVAKEVLEAEFPSYDLNRAFCIFNLPRTWGGLTPPYLTIAHMLGALSSNLRPPATPFNILPFITL